MTSKNFNELINNALKGIDVFKQSYARLKRGEQADGFNATQALSDALRSLREAEHIYMEDLTIAGGEGANIFRDAEGNEYYITREVPRSRR